MALVLIVGGCAASEGKESFEAATDAGDTIVDSADATPVAEDASPSADSGNLHILTYNVAGLPIGISGSNPLANTPLMSPLLNQYDLVLAQEDFTYHDALSADALHPYKSTPMPPVGAVPVADGLNRFANVAFDDVQRLEWDECNGLVGDGNDCLAPKGFSFARHTLAPGVTLDVYNMHADAGRGQDDRDARDAQVAQLAEFIETNSAGQAVLVAGDTNMKQGDEATLMYLLNSAGLTDSCVAVECPNPEVYDRLMFRSSDALTIAAEEWWMDPEFVDSLGLPLSDHPAIGMDLRWVLN